MNKLKIALLCGPGNGSPKVLAETMKNLISNSGNDAVIYYEVKALRRLLPSRNSGHSWYLWQLYKLKHFFRDRKLFSKLRSVDAVIICNWTPSGFYKDTYNIPKFKTIIGNKPVLYYAVQYLHNSPTIIKKLKDGGHALEDRYDWHLSVSSVTELRGIPSPPWSQVGLNLKNTGIQPVSKDEFIALVDFLRPGYESYREEQIRVLKELNIKFISLEKKYLIQEIRKIYSQSAVYFIQFPESYGLPIAECLAYGVYVATPDSSWPMSWRLNKNPEVHGPGELPACFVVYNGEDDLRKQLITMMKSYDLHKTPRKVFDIFYKNYRSFYEGNPDAIEEILKRIRNNDFGLDHKTGQNQV